MIYLISDTHCNHVNIRKLCNRPPNHELLIFNGLTKVGKNDSLIHLGDVVFYKDQDLINSFVKQLPGRQKILIAGNHDKKVKRSEEWEKVIAYKDHYILDCDGLKILMTHRPQELDEFFKNEFLPIDIAIHGHIHNLGEPTKWVGKTLWVNLCVEHWGYKPVALENIIRIYNEGRN